MPDKETEALQAMLDVAEAAIGGMMVHMRPLVLTKIRDVLERNESIVSQTPEALDHLTNEIADTLFPKR